MSTRLENLLLNKDDLKKIHITSIDILENIGIRLLHNELLEYVSDFDGIKTDNKNHIIKFSEDIVNKSVGKAKKFFRVFGRDKKKSADFGFGKMITSSSWGMPFKIDIINNKKIPASINDLKNSTIICDFLENIDITGAMFRPNEIPEYFRDIYEYGEIIKRTNKPIGVFITNRDTLKYILEINKIFLKNEKEIENYPPFSYLFENISPLVFQHDGVDILYKCSKLGIPITGIPIPQPMTTGPVTIAGSLALGNAEVLACVVLTQLIKPGLPFLYGVICNVPDPFTLIATFNGAPENVLFSIGQAQLAKYYGFSIFLDNQITCSNQVDYQMGAEMGINSLIGLVLGADIYGHIGIVGADQGASLIKLILDEEIISYIKRIKKFFNVNDETLAIDIIKKVGIGGNFLLENHTLKYMKSEYWIPRVFNRDSYTVWEKKNGKSLIEKVLDYKNHILNNHKVNYVEKDIEDEIDNIISCSMKDLKKEKKV